MVAKEFVSEHLNYHKWDQKVLASGVRVFASFLTYFFPPELV